jgi:membrane protein required for colicin V production
MAILGSQWIWIDIAIVVIVAISMLISLLRGFVKEALSLATWIAAILVGRFFCVQLATLLVDKISEPSARLAVAFALLFVGTLIVGALINQVVSQLIKATGLSGTDRVLGMVFGFARGLLVVAVVVGLLSMTPVTQDSWWNESKFIPQILPMWDWAKTTATQITGSVFKTNTQTDNKGSLREQVTKEVNKQISNKILQQTKTQPKP